MQLTIIAAILISILGVAFAMQNNVPVTVNFLLWRLDSSLAMVLLLALALGAIIIALLTTPATLRWQWLTKRQKRRIEELEKSCDGQRRRIAELESHLPPETDAAEPRPYAGLMQLIGSRENEAVGESKQPPV
jgi:putative membrane protein